MSNDPNGANTFSSARNDWSAAVVDVLDRAGGKFLDGLSYAETAVGGGIWGAGISLGYFPLYFVLVNSGLESVAWSIAEANFIVGAAASLYNRSKPSPYHHGNLLIPVAGVFAAAAAITIPTSSSISAALSSFPTAAAGVVLATAFPALATKWATAPSKCEM